MKEKMKRIFAYGLPILALCLIFRYFSNFLSFGATLIDSISALLIGFCIAYALNIVMRKLEAVYFPNSQKPIVKKTRRPVCVCLSILIILLVLTVILLLILPKLGDALILLGSSIMAAFDWITVRLKELSVSYPSLEDDINAFLAKYDIASIAKQLAAAVGGFGKNFLTSTTGVIASITSAVVQFMIAFIFALYMLFGKETLISQTKRLGRAVLPKKTCETIDHLVAVFDDSFSKYIIGQCTEACILGLLCTLGMLLFRFPYAPMVGAVVGVTALLPVVGAYIGAGVGFFLILMVNPIKAILFVIFIMILQQLENNLIYPRVVGSSIGLPGIWVLTAVTIGGALFGVIGILFGVPTFSAIYNLTREFLAKREAEQAGNK